MVPVGGHAWRFSSVVAGVDARKGNFRVTDRTTTTYDAGTVQTNKVHYDYDTSLSDTYPEIAYGAGAPRYASYTTTFGNVTRILEYDWGAGLTPGALLRQTDMSYLTTNPANGNIIYTSKDIHIVNKLAEKVVRDKAGTILEQTQYEYDGSPLAATSGVPQHFYLSFCGSGSPLCSYSASNRTRGNLTAIKRWRSTDNLWLTTTYTYNDLGNRLSETDPLGHTTTFDYTDDYNDGISRNTQTYVTAITYPATTGVSHIEQKRYYYTTGLLYQEIDQNNQARTYAYDNMNRPSSILFPPGGGQITYSYNDPAAPPKITTTKKITEVINLVSEVELDGLGRTRKSKLVSDPQGAVYTRIEYDGMDRKWKEWNPTRCDPDISPTSCAGETTFGKTEYQYDRLGRVTKLIPPDGTAAANNVTTMYAGNCTTVTDQAGKLRKSCTDALGRLIQVFEPDASGSLVNETDYQYDALDNLTCVEQRGGVTGTGCASPPSSDSTSPWRIRRFTYNSLSQLTSATNPESGTINYTYDADGNLLTKADARGIVTTHSYDALHRLTGKTYSNLDPAVSYFYDQASYNGLVITNGIGRRTGMSDAAGTEAWSYDAMGRVLTGRRTTGGVAKDTGYTYNLDGSLASLRYPSGRVVKNAYSTAGRPTQVTFDNFNGTPVGYNYLSAATYTPSGAPWTVTLGNGLVETSDYNTRLQPMNQKIASSVLTPFFHSYSFYDPLGKNNGNVTTITDNLAPGRTQTFTYDSLNRISTAQSAAPSGTDCWAQSFGYDAWANLLTESPTRAGCPMTSLNLGVNTNNRITNTGFSYDAAGNLLADATNSYAYDAESHIKTLNGTGAAYTYDADGQRVYKQVGSDTTEYIYLNGEPLAERKANGDWSDYIFAGSRRLARADSYEDGILIQGNNCSNCGWLNTWFRMNDAQYLSGYTIQSGDKLYWRQYQWNARGGLGIFFTDASNNAWRSTDQNGRYINDDPLQNSWDYRYTDLSAYAGKVISWLGLANDGNSPSGAWTIVFGDIALVSADGTVRPIYNGSASFSVSLAWTSTGVTAVSVSNRHLSNIGWNPNTTTNYYGSDHLGSARTLLSYWGYPVWSATYLPFGQEWNAQPTVNHYKFTSYERDPESGNDYALARYHLNRLGRFNSPDLIAGSLVDPQSLNRYAYVANDPVNRTDRSGLDPLPYEDESGPGFGANTPWGAWNEAQGAPLWMSMSWWRDPSTLYGKWWAINPFQPDHLPVQTVPQLPPWITFGRSPHRHPPAPAPPKTPNGPREWIARQLAGYRECVKQGTRGLENPVPATDDVVREAMRDQRPRWPATPGPNPPGPSLPAPNPYNPSRDLFLTIIEDRRFRKWRGVEDDCERKFPLGILSPDFKRTT